MSTQSSGGADNVKPRVPARLGRFELKEFLGGGAFGVVFRAYDPQLEREVALKIPRPGTLTTAKRVERFLGDAKSAAQLRHPHIVPVFDCGKDGEWIYIACAYIRGQTLAEAVDDKAMEPMRAARIAMKLAEALAYAHANEIIHRDVKPHNVMLDEHGEPHLIDFGLAQRGEKTEDGQKILGTYGYMSPEQVAGNSSEAKAAFDQYALGITLYELLTGRTPFGGSGEMKRFHTINTPPPPPLEVNPNIPLDLALICLKAISKHADNRYPDCAAMANDLRTYLAGGVASVRKLSTRERVVRWVKTEPKLASAIGVVGLLVVLLAIVGVAFGVYSTRQNQALKVANKNAEDNADQARKAEGEAIANARAAAENAKKAQAAKVLADENARTATENEQTANTRSAEATFDKAITLGEQGEVGQCLIELANALGLAEKAKNKNLEGVIRQNLAGWRRQLHRLAAVHTFRVSPAWLMFHPEKEKHDTIFFGCADGATASHVVVCDLFTGAIKPHVAAGASLTRTAATSLDRTVLLTISNDGIAHVFNTATGESLGPSIRTDDDKVRFLCGVVLDQERIILGRSDGAVVLYRRDGTGWLAQKTVQHKLLGGCEVRAIAIHPSGEWVLTAGGNRLSGQIVLRRIDLSPVHEITETLMPVTAAAFSPDGKTFVTGHGTLLNGEVRMWDTDTRTLRQGGVFRHQSEVYAVTFSPNGRFLATASQDRSARVFDGATLTPIGQPLWHAGDVLAIAFAPDSRRLVTAGKEEALRVWELAPGPTANPSLQLRSAVIALAAHQPTNQMFTGGVFTGQGWDPRDFRERKFQQIGGPGSAQPILAATYNPDGSVLLLGSGAPNEEGRAVLFDQTSTQIGDSFNHSKPVIAVAFHPINDKHFATGSADGIARLYDYTAPQKAPITFPHAQNDKEVRLYAVRFSPDGKYLLTGGTDRRVVLWDVATGKEFAELPLHPDAVLSAAFSSDGRWVVTGYAGAAILWDWQARGIPKEVGLLRHGPAGVVSVDVSPDGESILTGGTDGTARWWDRKTQKPLGPMWKPGPTAKHVAFWSDDKQMMIAGTDLFTGRVMIINRPPPVAESHVDVSLWVRASTGISAELRVLRPKMCIAVHEELKGRPIPKIEEVIAEEAKLLPPPPPPPPPVEPGSGIQSVAQALEIALGKPKDPVKAGKLDPKKLIGKWQSVNNKSLTVEFTKDGRLAATSDSLGKDTKLEGTYKLEGDNLSFKIEYSGVVIDESLTIIKLTDSELEGKDKDGKTEAFKRVK